MATQFKGIKLVKISAFSASSYEKKSDILYLVRTSAAYGDTKPADGFIYFNGKKYGSGEDTWSELSTLLGTKKVKYNNFAQWIAAVEDKTVSSITGDAFITVTTGGTESGDGQSVSVTLDVINDIASATTVASATQVANAKNTKEYIDAKVGTAVQSVSATPESNPYFTVQTDDDNNVTLDLNVEPALTVASATGTVADAKQTRDYVETRIKALSSSTEDYVTVTSGTDGSGKTAGVSVNVSTNISGESGNKLADAKATWTAITGHVDTEIKKLDGGVTAGTGQYISSITETDGVVTGECANLPVYTIATATTTDTYLKTYALYKDDVLVEGSKIDIPKDFLVKDGFAHTFESAVASGSTYTANGYTITANQDFAAGDIAIIMVVNVKSDEPVANTFIQIKANSLIDAYSGGTAININNHKINVILDNNTTPENSATSYAAHKALSSWTKTIAETYFDTISGTDGVITTGSTGEGKSGKTATFTIDGSTVKTTSALTGGNGATTIASGATMNNALQSVLNDIKTLNTNEIAKGSGVSGTTDTGLTTASDLFNDIYAKISATTSGAVADVTSTGGTLSTTTSTTATGKEINLEVDYTKFTTTQNKGLKITSGATDGVKYDIDYEKLQVDVASNQGLAQTKNETGNTLSVDYENLKVSGASNGDIKVINKDNDNGVQLGINYSNLNVTAATGSPISAVKSADAVTLDLKREIVATAQLNGHVYIDEDGSGNIFGVMYYDDEDPLTPEE